MRLKYGFDPCIEVKKDLDESLDLGTALDELRWFLFSRERDIAFSLENFGLLKSVFIKVIGREPSKKLEESKGV